MDNVKIKVIDSDKLINAINEGSYDINLSAVMALGAAMLDTKSEEFIYKQAAIDALCHVDEYNGRSVDAIKNLPSVQLERKKGKWIPDNRPSGGFWVCSCCKFPSEAFAADVLYKFCPNCGADMRTEE